MSTKLPVVSGADLARVAEHLGFGFRRQRGSHAIYVRAADKRRIVIPLHRGKALKPKTLAGILADLGISADKLRAML